MTSTREALREVSANVDESMGIRRRGGPSQLSPVPSERDIGRRPLRTFGSLEIDRVVPDPDQPRTEFAEDDIERLAQSIRVHGQLHPIRVRWDEPTANWIIVTGERRWRATKLAGLPTIDCFFVDGELTDAELREQQLVENLLRTDLKPLEEAKAYQSLMELNGWTGKQVAEALRVTTSRVSRSLALLDLPEHIKQQVDQGVIPKSSAYEITKLRDRRQQIQIADMASEGQPHAKMVRQIKQRRGRKGRKPRTGTHQEFFAESGIKVIVASKKKVNYHEVELALTDAIDEVRHRIRNNIKIF